MLYHLWGLVTRGMHQLSVVGCLFGIMHDLKGNQPLLQVTPDWRKRGAAVDVPEINRTWAGGRDGLTGAE